MLIARSNPLMSCVRDGVRRGQSEHDAAWMEPKGLPRPPWAVQGANANHPELWDTETLVRGARLSLKAKQSRKLRQRGPGRSWGGRMGEQRMGSTFCHRETSTATATRLFQSQRMLLAFWAMPGSRGEAMTTLPM